jgi:hypothetical protein
MWAIQVILFISLIKFPLFVFSVIRLSDYAQEKKPNVISSSPTIGALIILGNGIWTGMEGK